MKEELKKLLENSYSPYSKFRVSSIVVTNDGNIFKGVNVENASFGATICAERNAINSAICAGEREFSALYLMTDLDSIAYPCNLCKQTMLEFFDDKVLFNIMNTKGDMEVLSFKEVMTKIFSKGDLM